MVRTDMPTSLVPRQRRPKAARNHERDHPTDTAQAAAQHRRPQRNWSAAGALAGPDRAERDAGRWPAGHPAARSVGAWGRVMSADTEQARRPPAAALAQGPAAEAPRRRGRLRAED